MRAGLRSSFIMVGILGLAACAGQSRWVHPTEPTDQWALDASTCRAQANRLIGRELGREGISTDRHVTELEKNLRSFDAKKRRTYLFERCMQREGYVKAKPPKESS